MNPSEDHVLDWLTSPLWGHVANTLYGDEVKTIVLLNVTRDLAVCEPRSPFFLNGPAEHLNPLLGAVGGDCAISVARVEHDACLVLEDGVDPHRALVQLVVVNCISALGPGLNFGWNVECLTDILSIHVVGEVVSENGLFVFSEGAGFEPWSVL